MNMELKMNDGYAYIIMKDCIISAYLLFQKETCQWKKDKTFFLDLYTKTHFNANLWIPHLPLQQQF